MVQCLVLSYVLIPCLLCLLSVYCVPSVFLLLQVCLPLSASVICLCASSLLSHLSSSLNSLLTCSSSPHQSVLGLKIQHQMAQSHAFTVPQILCVTSRLFASGNFLFSVGDAENLNKGTICHTIRHVCLALKSFTNIFITFPGHRRPLTSRRSFTRLQVTSISSCNH